MAPFPATRAATWPEAGAVMPATSPWRGFATRGLATVLACTLIAATIAGIGGGDLMVSLVYSFSIGLQCWLAVDGGRVLAARAVRRWRPADAAALQGWPGWPLMTLVIATGTSIAYASGTALADAITGVGHAGDGQAWRGYVLWLLVSIVAGAVITGYHYAKARLELTRAEAEAARRLAAENQLRLLQSQLEPHMLFNTLANLRVLIGADAQRAQAMLDHLIAFLRATLAGSRRDTHRLADEFARLHDYLALMQVRMGARLQTRLELPPALAELPVPPLLLQPLDENAIRHGLEPKVAGGRIEVHARVTGGELCLTVRDTGVGLGAAASARAADAASSFGLDNVRARLHALRGDDLGLRLRAAGDDEGGTLAEVCLPRPAPAAASPAPAPTMESQPK